VQLLGYYDIIQFDGDGQRWCTNPQTGEKVRPESDTGSCGGKIDTLKLSLSLESYVQLFCILACHKELASNLGKDKPLPKCDQNGKSLLN
jgi:hypothetical protein